MRLEIVKAEVISLKQKLEGVQESNLESPQSQNSASEFMQNPCEILMKSVVVFLIGDLFSFLYNLLYRSIEIFRYLREAHPHLLPPPRVRTAQSENPRS